MANPAHTRTSARRAARELQPRAPWSEPSATHCRIHAPAPNPGEPRGAFRECLDGRPGGGSTLGLAARGRASSLHRAHNRSLETRWELVHCSFEADGRTRVPGSYLIGRDGGLRGLWSWPTGPSGAHMLLSPANPQVILALWRWGNGMILNACFNA
ncbi:hypothetical protein L226DRAFT_202540 [Lentinus tigrinus ALCF2SS1-7]|uniref:uncharacterized protein n=1 Tax=Lentinus tigrinus ALCF2SS1-7 TaxID=1328758 RepID=UPI0011662250|nr:hypothetical protein L226DRAFT_202540 [Lentinus tigrinus ALCF2SS1-7]